MFDNIPNQQWDQIPFKQNLVPYNDLQAQGGYNRQLILPDDVQIALSPPVLMQDGVPRLATMNADGGMNVHTVNGGGGGGGGGIVDMNSHYWSTNNGHFTDGHNMSGNGEYLGSVLYGFSYAFSLGYTNQGGSDSNTVQFGLKAQNTGRIFYLGLTYIWHDATSNNRSVSGDTVFLPNPLNLDTIFGGDIICGYAYSASNWSGALLALTSS